MRMMELELHRKLLPASELNAEQPWELDQSILQVSFVKEAMNGPSVASSIAPTHSKLETNSGLSKKLWRHTIVFIKHQRIMKTVVLLSKNTSYLIQHIKSISTQKSKTSSLWDHLSRIML